MNLVFHDIPRVKLASDTGASSRLAGSMCGATYRVINATHSAMPTEPDFLPPLW